MRIDQIIARGHGTAHAWRVEREESDPYVGSEYSLWHYGTRMLVWRSSTRHGAELVDYSTGWGSVSDQNGMNTAFRVLGLPYRYDRDQRGGGPRVTELVRASDGQLVRAEHLEHYEAELAAQLRRPIPAGHPDTAAEHDRRAAAHEAAGNDIAADIERRLAAVDRALPNLAALAPAELHALPYVWQCQLAELRTLPTA